STSGNGVVSAVSLVNPAAAYIVRPSNAVSTTTNGAGSGATLNLTYGPPPSDIAQTTTFTDGVSLPATFTGNDLEVTVDITHPDLSNLALDLLSPLGNTIHLLKNHIDGSGSAVTPAQGVTGANLGEFNGWNLGTIFDDAAPRTIKDASFVAPYVGH